MSSTAALGGPGGACKVCGGVNFEIEDHGSKVCRDCGHVLEDSCIVSEVQFEENARGGANVIGQYVGDTNRFHIEGLNHFAGYGRESREITLANGKRRIKEVASQLKLNTSCADMAFNFYKMAVSRHLTRGRKMDYVVAACIYLVCRTQDIPHMLLDLSDIVSVNVYYLGRTYLKLSHELCIKVNAIDPCLYIRRFAELLEFGDKITEVSNTALRLVHRMKRDWMHFGRRPSGLCGAALVVAARLHNFNRSIEDVTRVVRMSHATIRKRLLEFEETPTAELTLEEFNEVDLESECDPPCFTEGKKRAAELQTKLENANVEEEVAQLEEVIERQLQKDLERRNRRFRKYLEADAEDAENEDASDAGSVKSGMTNASKDTFKDEDFKTMFGSKKFKFEQKEGENEITENEFKILAQTTLEEVTGMKRSRPNTPDEDVGEVDDENVGADDAVDPEVARIEADEMRDILDGSGVPTGVGLGIAESVKKCLGGEKAKMENNSKSASRIKAEPSEDEDTNEEDEGGGGEEEEEDTEIDLTGIDDEEIDALILTEEEVKVKTLVWCHANVPFLQEEKERKRQEAEDLANGVVKKQPPKTRRSRAGGGGSGGGGNNKNGGGGSGEAATATEAVEKMLREKKISTKINYDVLKNLECDPVFGGGGGGGYSTTVNSSSATSASSASLFQSHQRHHYDFLNNGSSASSASTFKTPSRSSDSKPSLFNQSRFKRKIEPAFSVKEDVMSGGGGSDAGSGGGGGGVVKRRATTTAGPNLFADKKSGGDAFKVKNSSQSSTFHQQKKEPPPSSSSSVSMKKEEKDDDDGDDDEEEDDDDEEEEAVSVSQLLSSQFGKEENDFDDYDLG